MILADNEILDRIENFENYKEVYSNRDCKPLIENFKKENLQSVSYDVSITNKVWKYKDSFKKINLTNENNIKNLYEEVDISCGYELRANEYILVQLNEHIYMPDDLAGHIRPRTSFTRIGLILTANQHINPSYNGQLFLGLHNVSPYVMEICPELIIGQVVFEKLSGKADVNNLYHIKDKSKYNNEKEFIGSKIYDEFSNNEQKQIENEVRKILKSLKLKK